MFQKSVIDRHLKEIDKSVLESKFQTFQSIFADSKKQANIRASKEEQYQEGFIRDLFCTVLGYTIKPEANYNIFTEAKNDVKDKSNSKKADGAICEENNEEKIRAVIELKGTNTTDLDKVAFQAFSYKNFHTGCSYVIVSNFERLRFYVDVQSDYVEFNLFDIAKSKSDLFSSAKENFSLLYLLLSFESMKSDIPLKMKSETVSEEKEITDKFYRDYSNFKRALFADIVKRNSDGNKLALFKMTQKLLDRIIFIRFCSDRGLLPTNSVAGIIADWKQLKKLGYPQPLYSLFKTFFERINHGFVNEDDHSRDIFAYNGGLFKTDDALDALVIGDEVLRENCEKIAQYDFESQISVDILGRIFENSLTEIEEVQAELASGETAEKSSKRKKDGVFYTPHYITKYIVENTIGKLCAEKRNELRISDEDFNDESISEMMIKSFDSRLASYREWLLNLKILDPACGSGAFLNAALKQLQKEHELVRRYWAKIHPSEFYFENIDNAILENNLFGVDINEESVEIAKLSLWLGTAKKNRKLSALGGNIKCGNSLIDDKNVAGEKAFDWKNEFPEVFCEKPFSASPFLQENGEKPFGASPLSQENGEKPFSASPLSQENGEKPFSASPLLQENGEKPFGTSPLLQENGEKPFSASPLSQENGENPFSKSPLSQENRENLFSNGFDVIIGNPPYVSVNNIKDAKQKNYYKTHYKTAKEMFDLYSIFTEKAAKLLKPNGLFGFIFSNSWLGIKSFESFREFLAKDVTVTRLVQLPEKVFKDATVKTIICLYTNKTPEETDKITIEKCENSVFSSKGFTLPYKKILSTHGYNFTLEQNIELNKVPTVRLGDIMKASCGIKSANDKKFILNEKKDDDCYPIIRGRNLKRWGKVENSENEYIWYKPKLMSENVNARPRSLAFFTVPQKIFIQEIAQEINATLDCEQYLCNDTLNLIYELKDGYDMKFILCLLNSKLINFWFKQTFQSGLHVKVNQLEQIPIPAISLDEQKPFVEFADKMLNLNADVQKKCAKFLSRVRDNLGAEANKGLKPLAMTATLEKFYALDFAGFVKELGKQKIKLSLKEQDEWQEYFDDYKADITALTEQIEATDKAINAAVYALYGLSAEEISAVEG